MVWAVKIISIIGSVELDIGVCSSFPLLTLPRPHPLSPSLSLTSLSRSLSLSPALSFVAAYPTQALCLEYTFLRWHRHRLHRSLLSPSAYVSALSRSLSASSRRLSCRLVLGENCLVAFPCQIFGRLPWGSPASPSLLHPSSSSSLFFSLSLARELARENCSATHHGSSLVT